MLQALKKANNRFVVKLLYSAVILSFGSYGIAEFVSNVYNSASAIKVGKTKITRAELTQYIYSTCQNYRDKITIDNFDRIVDALIDKTVNETIINEYIRVNDLFVSDIEFNKYLTQSIMQSKTGRGITPKEIACLRRRAGTKLKYVISNESGNMAFAASASAPEFIKDIMVKDHIAPRRFHVINVALASHKIKTSDITDEDVMRYYNSHLDMYKIPEKRDVSVLFIDLAKYVNNDVFEYEIADYYRNNIKSFSEKLSGDFKVLKFSSKDSANEAMQLLRNGETAEDIVRKISAQSENIIGIKPEDNELSHILFKMDTGDVSDVISIDQKYCIYICTNMRLGKTKTLDSVRNEIKQSIIKTREDKMMNYDRINMLHNKIDDMIASNTSINDISLEMNIPLIDVKQTTLVNITDHLRSLPVNEIALNDIAIQAFHATEDKLVRIQIGDNDSIYCLLSVTNIQPSTLPSKADYDVVLNDLIKSKQKHKILDAINEISALSYDQRLAKAKDLGECKTIISTKKDIHFYIFHKYGQGTNGLEPTKEVLQIAEIDSNTDMLFVDNVYYGLEDYRLYYGQNKGNNSYVIIIAEPVESSIVVNQEMNKGAYDKVDMLDKLYVSKAFAGSIKRDANVYCNDKVISKVKRSIRSYILNS